MALSNLSNGSRNSFQDMNAGGLTAEGLLEMKAKIQNQLYRDMEENMHSDLAFASHETSLYDELQSFERNEQDCVQSDHSTDDHRRDKSKKLEEYALLLNVRARENERLLGDVEERQKDCEKLKSKVEMLNDDKRKLEIAIDDANSLLMEKHEKINQLEDRCTALEARLNDYITRNDKLETEKEFSHLTIKDLERKLTLMTKDSRTTVESIQLQRQLNDLEEKHRKEMNQAKEEAQILFQKLKKLESENCELSMKLKQSVDNNAEMLSQKGEVVRALTAEIDLLKGRSSSTPDVQLELSRLRQREADLQAELMASRQRFEAQNDELTLLKVAKVAPSTSSAVHTDVSRMFAENKSLRTEINALQERIKDKEKIEHSLREELSTAKEYLREKNQQLEQLQARSDVSLSDDQKITEMRAENENLRQRLVALEDENQGLLQQLSSRSDQMSLDRYNEQYFKFHEESMNKLRSEIEGAHKIELLAKDEILENLRDEISKVKEAYLVLKDCEPNPSKSEEDIKRLQNENDDFKLTIEKNKSEIESLISEKSKLRHECDILLTQLKETQEKCGNLQVEFSEKEDQLVLLEKAVEEVKLQIMENEEYKTKYEVLKSSMKEPVDVQTLKADLELSRLRLIEFSKTHSEHCLQGKEEREKRLEELMTENKNLKSDLQKTVFDRQALLSRINKADEDLIDLKSKATMLEAAISKRDLRCKELMDIAKKKDIDYAALLETLAEKHEQELLAAHAYFASLPSKQSSSRPGVDVGTLTDRQEITATAPRTYASDTDLLMATTRVRQEQLQELNNQLSLARSKYSDLKVKTRRYKAYFEEAFLRLEQEAQRDRERYVQMLSGLRKEIQLLPKHMDGNEAWRRFEPVSRLYEQKMNDLLHDFEQRQSKR